MSHNGPQREMDAESEIEYRRATRQSVEMRRDEIWDFVSGSKKMVVAYCLDSVPHATPVYFVCLDKKLYFRGPAYDRKMKPASGGSVSCLFEAGVKYTELKGVLIRGTSVLLADEGRLAAVSAELGKKYSGLHWRPEEMPHEWVEARRKETRTLVEVTPAVVSSWDNGRIGEPSKR